MLRSVANGLNESKTREQRLFQKPSATAHVSGLLTEPLQVEWGERGQDSKVRQKHRDLVISWVEHG